MKVQPLEFEKPIVELERKLDELKRESDAQDIDLAGWSRNANPDILNATTVSHITIHGRGNGPQNGATDFYKFAVTSDMLAAATNHDAGSSEGSRHPARQHWS